MSLGVAWVDYANVASELGIDILRYASIPGLMSADVDATVLQNTYT